MKTQSSGKMRSELIDQCCDGLIAYANILTKYELTWQAKQLLAELIRDSIWHWVSCDEQLFKAIEKFFSMDTNCLERTAFYESLFKTLVRRREFLMRVTANCDAARLFDRR